MKICVPIDVDRGLDSPVSAHFGRAGRFAIVDVASREVVTHVPVAGSGCDRHAGDLRRLDVDAVVCHGMGRGALTALRGTGIDVLVAPGAEVRSILDAVARGQATEFGSTDACAGHAHGAGGHAGGGVARG